MKTTISITGVVVIMMAILAGIGGLFGATMKIISAVLLIMGLVVVVKKNMHVIEMFLRAILYDVVNEKESNGKAEMEIADF